LGKKTTAQSTSDLLPKHQTFLFVNYVLYTVVVFAFAMLKIYLCIVFVFTYF